jgi:hypothetical protein
MKRLIPVIALAALISGPAHAAGPQDQQAEMKKDAGSPGQDDGRHDDRNEKQARLQGNHLRAARSSQEARLAGRPGDRHAGSDDQAGQKNAKPFTVLPMCKQDLAESLLKTQAEQKAMPFAPCRMSVFEGTDGKVYIAKPNTEFMAKMATPVFAPLLKKFVEEEKAVLANIAE